MPPHYFGFTNRILSQEDGSKTNLFVPVYVAFRIKSIHKVDVQELTGELNAVLIVSILVEGLPEPLVHMLENSVELQINRS